MSEPLSTVAITNHFLIAFFGGLAHAINKHRNGESKSMTDFILLTIMSSFFGVLFGFIAISLYPNNEYLTMAVAGSGGWFGIESTGILFSIIAKKIQK
jgi:hypothetical protein